MDFTHENIKNGQSEDRFAEREDYYFVGRCAELTRFRNYLGGLMETRTLWNISGTGGIGKTALLAAFRRMANRTGGLFLLIDSCDVVHRESEICLKVLSLLEVTEINVTSSHGSVRTALLDTCIGALRTLAKERRVILAFDNFEEFADIEAWIRERLFPALVDRVLLIVSGRQPLGGLWTSSPAWRECMHTMTLNSLERDEAIIYAERCGLNNGDDAERVWLASRGHPLALSLATAHRTSIGAGVSSVNSDILLQELVEVWLKEAADLEVRRLVEAASLMKRFNASLLAAIAGVAEIPTLAFDKLIRISFIRKVEQGWAMHDLVRGAVAAYLRESEPDRYKILTDRLVRYFANRILEFSGERGVSYEVGELYQYVGGEIINALNRGIRTYSQWEQVNSETVTEAKRYLQSRFTSPSNSVSVAVVDPGNGQEVRLEFSDALLQASLHQLNVKAWYELDNRSLFLLRGEDREVAGFAAILPIHNGTMSYLEQDPFSAPYMTTLSSAMRRSMAVAPDEPVGWFIRSIDYCNWADHLNRNEIFPLMFNYLCAGKLLLASPPPIHIFRQTHERMGFEAIPGSEHECYHGVPTPMLVLDTRGEKLARLLKQLMQRAGIDWQQHVETLNTEGWGLLSIREQEVAQLVVQGLSNADIAAQLYISEATVKRHLSTIFDKLGLQRRSQLAPRLGLH